MRFENDHYLVAVPGGKDRPSLPNTRKGPSNIRLIRRSSNNHWRGSTFFVQVSPNEPTSNSEWLLLHYSFARPETSGENVKCNKLRLSCIRWISGKEFLKNSEGLSRPKLQTDTLNILVRLRKELFALLGDASQMRHQPPSSFIHHTDFQGLKSE